MTNSDTKIEAIVGKIYMEEDLIGGANDIKQLIATEHTNLLKVATERTNVLAEVKELIGEQVTFEFPLASGDAGQRVFIDLEELEEALKKLEDQNE